ncbi:SHOCT domain-containing protein [Nodosilinea sp. LEGE 07088]|uniref:SHOCT domain-containing protein n=1 Tax=Nodosilinea sp. LEGE 07088 TaxID=2777968 RepID=UPI0018829E28|nr:SHOCT domain-containing protein [Nodosilinea sp. LEGE 07088]MBE9138103.1 SHOCT domain-containing protein [Nodosilinea sp. LEGE 07088]
MPRRGRRPTVTVQRRGPGIVGTMARTAVIAGTATATSRAVGGAMTGSAQKAQQQEMANAAAMQSQAELEQLQAQMAAMQAQQAVAATPTPAATPAAAPAGNDMLAQLQQLAQLKESGVLSDEEFQLAKAKLLAG